MASWTLGCSCGSTTSQDAFFRGPNSARPQELRAGLRGIIRSSGRGAVEGLTQESVDWVSLL